MFYSNLRKGVLPWACGLTPSLMVSISVSFTSRVVSCFAITRLTCRWHLCFPQVRKGKSDVVTQVVPQPRRSAGLPHTRPLSIPIVLPLTSQLRSPSPEAMDTAPVLLARPDTPDAASQPTPPDISPASSMEALSRSVCQKITNTNL